MSRQRRSLLRIFQAPMVIGAVCFTGLVLALLVDGKTELFAVLAVGCPISVVAWAYRRRFAKGRTNMTSLNEE